MDMSCPGRRTRDLDSTIVRCDECGRPVEIFSDEPKARCRCGKVMLRDALPSCISWCPAAERCLGQVIDVREVRKRIETMRGKIDAAGYVEKVGREIAGSAEDAKGAGENDHGGKADDED